MSGNASDGSPPHTHQRWSERHVGAAAPVYAVVYMAISFTGVELSALRLPIALDRELRSKAARLKVRPVDLARIAIAEGLLRHKSRRAAGLVRGAGAGTAELR
jgi:hypothetical protein